MAKRSSGAQTWNDALRPVNRSLRAVTPVVATLLAGCDTLHAVANGVIHPMTPQQSRSRVVDAATEVSHLIARPVKSAMFWHSLCSDHDQGPFRGDVTIAYQPSADHRTAAAEFDDMTQRLRRGGWSSGSDFISHATTSENGGVDAALSPADASVAVVVIELYGECRDATTTTATKGDGEPLQLS